MKPGTSEFIETARAAEKERNKEIVKKMLVALKKITDKYPYLSIKIDLKVVATPRETAKK